MFLKLTVKPDFRLQERTLKTNSCFIKKQVVISSSDEGDMHYKGNEESTQVETIEVGKYILHLLYKRRRHKLIKKRVLKTACANKKTKTTSNMLLQICLHEDFSAHISFCSKDNEICNWIPSFISFLIASWLLSTKKTSKIGNRKNMTSGNHKYLI